MPRVSDRRNGCRTSRTFVRLTIQVKSVLGSWCIRRPMRRLGVIVVLLALMGTAAAKKAPAKAPPPEPPAQEAPVEEGSAAEDAPMTPEELEAQLPPHVKGPKLVDLGYEIELQLPEGMILLER